MTQAELNSIAEKMRVRDPDCSWAEAFTLARDVVGGVEHAYQALLKCMALSNKAASSGPDDVQQAIRHKLAEVLALLTSEAQVARWESTALAGNNGLAHKGRRPRGLKVVSESIRRCN